MKITQGTTFTFELTEEERMAFTIVDNVLRLVQDRIDPDGVVDPEDGQIIDEYDVGRARGVMDAIMNVKKWATF